MFYLKMIQKLFLVGLFLASHAAASLRYVMYVDE